MNEMLTAGFELMVIGMGIVFAFLVMLIVSITVMSSILQRWFPVQQAAKTAVNVSASADNSGVVAAITAAVIQYRGKHH